MNALSYSNAVAPSRRREFRGLQAKARRLGYSITQDANGETFSLLDGRLRRPITGLEHVELEQISAALACVRARMNGRANGHTNGHGHSQADDSGSFPEEEEFPEGYTPKDYFRAGRIDVLARLRELFPSLS